MRTDIARHLLKKVAKKNFAFRALLLQECDYHCSVAGDMISAAPQQHRMAKKMLKT